MSLLPAGDREGMMSEINVTPLVDVMLVLLTVFIIAAPLIIHAIPVNLPRAQVRPAPSESPTIRISVTADGSVFVDREAVPPAGVEAALKRRRLPPDVAVEILADESVAYGRVARVMAQIQRAGIARFAFVLFPERAGAVTRTP